MKTNKKVLCFLFLTFGLLTVTPASAQEPGQNPRIPFGGLWQSQMGSIVKIKENYGVLIYTPSESWKEYLNKITIKNIRQQDGKWMADEWVVTNEENMWLEAEWERVDNRIKRNMIFKGKRLETFFVKTEQDFSSLGTDPKAYYQRGIEHRRQGRHQEAISDYIRAIALNPHHQTWYHFPQFYDAYRQGLDEDALAAALRITMPGFFWNHTVLAAAYGQLGMTNEAAGAVETLRTLYPGYTVETLRQHMQLWNFEDELIDRMADGLRKAGLPENTD